MTLREWIIDQGLTQRAAADRFGVQEITLSRWLTGKAIPRRDQMAAIRDATGGRVEAGSFYQPAPA